MLERRAGGGPGCPTQLWSRWGKADLGSRVALIRCLTHDGRRPRSCGESGLSTAVRPGSARDEGPLAAAAGSPDAGPQQGTAARIRAVRRYEGTFYDSSRWDGFELRPGY